jgi:hypothetical protein
MRRISGRGLALDTVVEDHTMVELATDAWHANFGAVGWTVSDPTARIGNNLNCVRSIPAPVAVILV